MKQASHVRRAAALRGSNTHSVVSPRTARTRLGRRGAAFYCAMLCMMVFSIVGLSLANSTMSAVRLTRFNSHSNEAFNLAESGAERAILWLRKQPAPPSSIAPFDPFGGAQTLGSGTYSVTIDGDDANATLDRKRYVVRCQRSSGIRKETVELLVQEANFGRYAYFTDTETSSITGGAIWFKPGDVIDGPAHSNNTGGGDFNINWISSTAPIFTDTLTASGASINWAPSQPDNDSDFGKIFTDGSKGYKLGVDRIELPANTDKQRVAAWGGPTGLPSTPGVYLNTVSGAPAGGIYVVGDCSIEFKADGGPGVQRLEITTASGGTVKVEVDHKKNETTFDGGGSKKTTYKGVPNGVVYSTGDVTSLKGQITDSYVNGGTLVGRNAWTVATDLSNGKDVHIADNLQYQTEPDKTQPWDSATNLKAATFGIVSHNIVLDESCPTDLTVDGVMMAGGLNTDDGSFYNAAWNSKSPGKLHLVGGVIQKARGPVGTFNPTTGSQKTGYNKNYIYDRRMAVNPPPFFPTTGNYDRLSWMRLGQDQP